MVAVFPVMIHNDMIKMPSLLQLPVRTPRANLNLLQILRRQNLLLPRSPPQQFTPHHIGHKLRQRNIPRRILQIQNFVLRQRRNKNTQPLNLRQPRMRLQSPPHIRIPLEQNIPASQRRFQIPHIDRLQIAPSLKHRIPRISPQSLHLIPRTELVCDAVHFARPRPPAVHQHNLPQPRSQFRIELTKRMIERTLPHTRRPTKNDKPSTAMNHASLQTEASL